MLGFLAIGLGLTFWLAPGLPERELPRRVVELPSELPEPQPIPEPSPTLEACESLFAVACGKIPLLQDPTGIVQPDAAGEIEALRVYETIIHQHPDWTSEEVDEELVKEIYTDRRRDRIFDTFQWVERAMETFLDRQPASTIPAAARRKLKKRLRETQLELPPPASVYANEPELFTKNDVYYSSFADGRRVIRMGGAYLLSSKSFFNRVFTIAHELAHAIDPCEIMPTGVEVPSYRKIEGCFIKVRLVNRARGHCSPESLLPEVFADWVATEITADALEQYVSKFKNKRERLYSVINSVRDLCNDEIWLEDDLRAHPSARDRMDGIFAANPRIRAILQCEAPSRRIACELNQESP